MSIAIPPLWTGATLNAIFPNWDNPRAPTPRPAPAIFPSANSSFNWVSPTIPSFASVPKSRGMLMSTLAFFGAAGGGW